MQVSVYRKSRIELDSSGLARGASALSFVAVSNLAADSRDSSGRLVAWEVDEGRVCGLSAPDPASVSAAGDDGRGTLQLAGGQVLTSAEALRVVQRKDPAQRLGLTLLP